MGFRLASIQLLSLTAISLRRRLAATFPGIWTFLHRSTQERCTSYRLNPTNSPSVTQLTWIPPSARGAKYGACLWKYLDILFQCFGFFNPYLILQQKKCANRSWNWTYKSVVYYVWNVLHSSHRSIASSLPSRKKENNFKTKCNINYVDARPTSPCRRKESIVSLERGVCSCAELQVFSCYRGWKEACQATRAISAI